MTMSARLQNIIGVKKKNTQVSNEGILDKIRSLFNKTSDEKLKKQLRKELDEAGYLLNSVDKIQTLVKSTENELNNKEAKNATVDNESIIKVLTFDGKVCSKESDVIKALENTVKVLKDASKMEGFDIRVTKKFEQLWKNREKGLDFDASIVTSELKAAGFNKKVKAGAYVSAPMIGNVMFGWTESDDDSAFAYGVSVSGNKITNYPKEIEGCSDYKKVLSLVDDILGMTKTLRVNLSGWNVASWAENLDDDEYEEYNDFTFPIYGLGHDLAELSDPLDEVLKTLMKVIRWVEESYN